MKHSRSFAMTIFHKITKSAKLVILLIIPTYAKVSINNFFKSDFRLSRNLLKGQVGDEINVLMTACAWNLRKWLCHFANHPYLCKSLN
jgi:IS5 family transposase